MARSHCIPHTPPPTGKLRRTDSQSGSPPHSRRSPRFNVRHLPPSRPVFNTATTRRLAPTPHPASAADPASRPYSWRRSTPAAVDPNHRTRAPDLGKHPAFPPCRSCFHPALSLPLRRRPRVPHRSARQINTLDRLTSRPRRPIVIWFSDNWGRNGFDGDDDVRVARRGAPGHVKRGNHATANDNAVALAA